MFRSVASFCLSGIFALMILLPALLLLGACAQLPAEHRACAERAEAHATRVTRAAGSPEYQAAWIGNYQDEYRRCVVGK